MPPRITEQAIDVCWLFIVREDDPDNPDNLDTELCDRIVELAMRKGVFLIRTGRGTLKFGPPLNIPDDAIREALDVVGDAIEEAIAA